MTSGLCLGMVWAVVLPMHKWAHLFYLIIISARWSFRDQPCKGMRFGNAPLRAIVSMHAWHGLMMQCFHHFAGAVGVTGYRGHSGGPRATCVFMFLIWNFFIARSAGCKTPALLARAACSSCSFTGSYLLKLWHLYAIGIPCVHKIIYSKIIGCLS